MDNPTPEQIQQYIRDGINCTHIDVNGDGRHFFATIVSPAFEGLRTLARQRAVYATLGDKILGHDAHIHALSMKTYTPSEWTAEQAK
ncbi:MAG: BolA family transcriptional regulator [Burkholderiales bacterium]|nr:BolA family transcriptional regulator [Burkholderiales bacterium]